MVDANTQSLREALLGVRELAEWVGVTEQVIYDWRHRGVGPPGYRLHGGLVKYRPADVEKWLAEQADEPRTPLGAA